MLTKIRDIKTQNELSYTLPPGEALVAAHEQVVLNNFQTWKYKSPEAYPLQKTNIGLKLGNLVVVEVTP